MASFQSPATSKTTSEAESTLSRQSPFVTPQLCRKGRFPIARADCLRPKQAYQISSDQIRPDMREQHLELVQPTGYGLFKASSGGASIPLFLIHDGGGTTFAYHCLEPLGRPVYGIRNPRFRSGEPFAGGLPEMGYLYAGWIRSAVAHPDFPAPRNIDGSVDILIGGWSLGGIISLEILSELEDDPNIRIVGILMVDCVYPFEAASPLMYNVSDPLVTLGIEGKLQEQQSLNKRERHVLLSQRAMAEAGKMLRTWKVPSCSSSRSPIRPQVVLLRATGYTPTQGPQPSVIDKYREERTLGWDQYDGAMFDQVIDVQGHHFDLFEEGRIEPTSAAIWSTLQQMDRLANRP